MEPTKIKSLTPAEPGWRMYIEHRTKNDQGWILADAEDRFLYPVVMWAITESEGDSDRIDPVFYHEGHMELRSEHHECYKDEEVKVISWLLSPQEPVPDLPAHLMREVFGTAPWIRPSA